MKKEALTQKNALLKNAQANDNDNFLKCEFNFSCTSKKIALHFTHAMHSYSKLLSRLP